MLFISRKNLLMLPYLYLLKCIQIKTFFPAQHIFYNDLAIHFLLRNISAKQTWLKKSAVKVKQQQRLLSKLIPINSPVFVFLKQWHNNLKHLLLLLHLLLLKSFMMKHLRTLFLLFSTEVPKIIIHKYREREMERNTKKEKKAFLHKQRLTLIKGLILILFLMSLK